MTSSLPENPDTPSKWWKKAETAEDACQGVARLGASQQFHDDFSGVVALEHPPAGEVAGHAVGGGPDLAPDVGRCSAYCIVSG